MSVHSIAQNGFGKGTNELYDRARPSYPALALETIRSAITSPPPFNILELGSGTGIFTRAFLAHPVWSSSVRELRAVDPSEGMRAQFSQTINDPRVSVQHGTFQSTNLPDAWADLILIAQAFHWAPDYDKAMAEFNRALAPNGRLVLTWNFEDHATAWIHQVRRVTEVFEQDAPQSRFGLWRQSFKTPSYLNHFHPPEEFTFKHVVKGSLQGVIDRVCSKSYIAIQSEDCKADIAKKLTDIIERGDDKVWINEKEGTFEYPYLNTLIIMRKK